MAGLTKAQRAEKEARLAQQNPAPATVDDIPKVERGTPARTRLSADEEAERILANRKDFSGLELKLKAYGENPGWTRRWVNEQNVPGRLEEGYRFVERGEVSMSDSMRYGNQDIGDRVSIHAGTDDKGHPFSAYLMEIPNRVAEVLNEQKSYRQIRLSEESIRAGAVGNPSGNNRVGAKDGLPEIKLT